MDDLTGQTFGPYRVLERIGAGGMATVYRAYHAAMDRYVAIKVLPRHLARDPNFHARFMREARTIARLEHRYILTVHDVAEADGVPFLVMRYTNSGDLSGLIAGKSLSTMRVVQLVSQVAEALTYAHSQGVIHRDVKPGNVLIGPDGDALLTDFGIAKIYEDTLELTGEGHLVGTPAYMAPEQLQGQPVDARTDVYALGVVLYQALTSELPFVAETPLAVALMHLHNPLRPPRQVNPAIPESLERVVLRAMAKSPSERFQNAGEMARALHDALADLNKRTVMLDQKHESQVELTQMESQIVPPPPTPLPPAGPPKPVSHVAPPPPTPLPPPAATRRPPLLWLGVGATAIVALVLAVVLLRPGAAPSAATPEATARPGVAPSVAEPDATVAPSTALAADLRYPAATSKINDLAVTGDAVWAATDGGLVRWSADGSGRLFTTDDGLPFDEPGAVVAGADGTLWVGGGGVAHIRPTEGGIDVIAYYTKDDGLGSGVIRTLLVDADGSVWAGGPQQGESRFALSHFDGDTWRTDELPTDAPALAGIELNIQSLLRSSDGSLWLGDLGGLLRWDGESWASFGPSDGVGPGSDGGDVRIRQLAQSDDGTVWAAASELGLLRLDPNQGLWVRVQVVRDDMPIRAVVRLADGSLWAGGDGLVARSTDGGQTWTEVGTADSGIGDDIGSLVQDAAGQVWAGAYDGGVSVFDGTQWRALQR